MGLRERLSDVGRDRRSLPRQDLSLGWKKEEDGVMECRGRVKECRRWDGEEKKLKSQTVLEEGRYGDY